MFGMHQLPFNRGIIVANIAICNGAGNDFRKLIDCLTLQELKILKKDEGLVDRVKSILQLDAEDLREHFVKVWGLSAEECQNNDWWIDIEEARKKCPKWARATIEGHYVDGDDFVKWAQSWLMQEVRVNINIKRIEQLREAAKAKKEKQRKAQEEQCEEMRQCGMFDYTYL